MPVRATTSRTPIRDFVTTKRPLTKVRVVHVQDGHHRHEVAFLKENGALVVQIDGHEVWMEPEDFTLA